MFKTRITELFGIKYPTRFNTKGTFESIRPI